MTANNHLKYSKQKVKNAFKNLPEKKSNDKYFL